jgi:hypothetical protein
MESYRAPGTPFMRTNLPSFLAGMYNHLGDGEDASLAGARRRGLRGADGGVAPLEELVWTHADAVAEGRSCAEDARERAYRNERSWAAVCASPEGESGVPMNKVAWLAWSLGLLERQGVVFDSLGEGEEQVIHGEGAVGRYQVEVVGHLELRGVLSSFESHAVQMVSTEHIAVLIIDTSVGSKFGRLLTGTAGSVGKVGDRQLATIAEMLAEQSALGRRIYVAGHFPLRDLVSRDRRSLRKLFGAYGVRAYFSGHTHAPTSMTRTGGAELVEYNVASVSDWPMEALVASLDRPRPEISVVRAGRDCGLKYDAPSSRLSFVHTQACHHAPVAARLAAIARTDAELFTTTGGAWGKTEIDRDCDVRAAAESIAASMRVVEERAQDPVFRAFFSCLATAASSTECGRGHEAPCDSRHFGPPR